LFATAIGAFMGSIADVFNRHLIPRLLHLNGYDLTLAPKLVAEDIETPNIVEVADFISKLSAAGAAFFPDTELEDRLRQMAGLPPIPEEGFDMREHVNAIAPAGGDPNGDPNADPSGDPNAPPPPQNGSKGGGGDPSWGKAPKPKA
jgi:hypothetical protein